jgi:hypothetical protein
MLLSGYVQHYNAAAERLQRDLDAFGTRLNISVLRFDYAANQYELTVRAKNMIDGVMRTAEVTLAIDYVEHIDGDKGYLGWVIRQLAALLSDGLLEKRPQQVDRPAVCKATLEERASMLSAEMMKGARLEYLEAVVAEYGKDAMVSVVLDWLGLSCRSTEEKLAEVAFDLVPGQIECVKTTNMHSVVLPIHEPLNTSWFDIDGEVQVAECGIEKVDLTRWRGEMSFGFSERTSTLFVYNKHGGK